MLIQIWDTVIPYWNVRQEWQCPSESSAKDNVVYTSRRCAIFKMHGSIIGGNVRNRSAFADLGVFECMTTKVDVVFPAGDGVNG